MSTVTVKRRFAVVLEDAFEVPAPSDDDLAEYDGDVVAWAIGSIVEPR